MNNRSDIHTLTKFRVLFHIAAEKIIFFPNIFYEVSYRADAHWPSEIAQKF